MGRAVAPSRDARDENWNRTLRDRGEPGVVLRAWRAVQRGTASPFKHEVCRQFKDVGAERFLSGQSARASHLCGRWSPAFSDSLGGCRGWPSQERA